MLKKRKELCGKRKKRGEKKGYRGRRTHSGHLFKI